MKKIDLAAAALVLIGALDWGLVAIAELDLVATLFGLEFGKTNIAKSAHFIIRGTQVRILPGALRALQSVYLRPRVEPVTDAAVSRVHRRVAQIARTFRQKRDQT